DIITMKRPLKALLVVAAVLLPAMGLRLFHLGPLGIRPGNERVLARLTLTNGSTFAVVALRNRDLLEAYTVNLYRLDRNGGTQRYLLGFEESYWWGCALRLSNNQREIEI